MSLELAYLAVEVNEPDGLAAVVRRALTAAQAEYLLEAYKAGEPSIDAI